MSSLPEKVKVNSEEFPNAIAGRLEKNFSLDWDPSWRWTFVPCHGDFTNTGYNQITMVSHSQ